jgi:hypothetical protein
MKNTNAVILASVITAAGLHLAVQFAEVGRSPEHMRIMLGALLLLASLLLIGEFWPEGAQGLAIVILVTAFVMNGQKFFNLVNSLVD